MIDNPSMMLQDWRDKVLSQIVSEPDAYLQIRKSYRGVHWVFDNLDGINLSWERLGYSDNGAKTKQLIRNYYNEENMEEMFNLFNRRIEENQFQTNVSAGMGNKKKSSKSQGFCMQTITLSYIQKPEGDKPKFVVEIYYRSTEVLKKFLADLKFISEFLIPKIEERTGLKVDRLSCFFSLTYVSPENIPVLYQLVHPIELSQMVIRESKYWWDRTLKTTTKAVFEDKCRYTYQARVKMYNLHHRFVIPYMKPQEIRKINRLVNEKI